jgi:membrane fusion protein, copper/silver efflux system
MNRVALASATVVALIAATAAGFVIGSAWQPVARVIGMVTPAAAEVAKPIYYQDPDGKPSYSLMPKTTADGRDYRGVPAAADISFEETSAPKVTSTAPADRKIKYYRNPMGLPDTSPTPKKDPMGMAYIPVFEGDEADDGSVKLSPGKIQRTGVQSEPATRRVIRTAIRAPGTVQLDERRISVISMRAESWVQKVADVTTGTKVTKGQPLMDVYSPAVISAAAEYIATIDPKAASNVGLNGRGSRQRVMNLDVPESAIVAMEKTHTVPMAIEWTAPRDGIVLERRAIEGMRAQPGEVLFRVADVSVVWAIVDIAERDLGAIAVGQPVTVKARSFPGRDFQGKISVVYPQVSRETRTARVRIELANADLALLPDMYVDAWINAGNPDPVLAVPESAVLDTGSRQAVFIAKGDGRFEPRDVKLGNRGDGYIEVKEGVTEGAPVVDSANFLIDAESNLNAALKGFSEAGAKP